MDENKKAGASYVIDFYNQIQLLNHWYSLFMTTIVETQSKYKNVPDNTSTMAEEDTKKLSEIYQNLRYYIVQCYVKSDCINSIIKSENTQDITEVYLNINKSHIVRELDATAFVKLMNTFVTHDVVKNLLHSTTNLMKSIYGES